MSHPPEELVRTIGCVPQEEPIGVFERSKAGKLGRILGIVMYLTVGIVILAFFLYSSFVWLGDDELLQLVSTGLGGLMFLFFCGQAWSWASHYRNSADVAYLYEQGLVWHTAAANWEARRWADVTAIFRLETVGTGPRASYFRLDFANDKKIEFTGQLEDYRELVEYSQRFIHRELFPSVKKRFDAGESVEFGPITINRDELIIRLEGLGETRHRLAALREATIMRGHLWLNHKTPGHNPAVALVGIPNYTVLIALLPIVPEGWHPEAFE